MFEIPCKDCPLLKRARKTLIVTNILWATVCAALIIFLCVFVGNPPERMSQSQSYENGHQEQTMYFGGINKQEE